MLHSYGGAPEDVAKFCALGGGKKGRKKGGGGGGDAADIVGRRFFFSFSAAINGRAPEKLAARIAAVPADRLLLESDQVGSFLFFCLSFVPTDRAR